MLKVRLSLLTCHVSLNSGAIAGGVMHRRQTRTSSRGDENFPRKWAECDMGRDIYHWEHGIKCPTYFRASLQRLSKASTVFDPQVIDYYFFLTFIEIMDFQILKFTLNIQYIIREV